MSEQVDFETEQPDTGYWSVIPYPVLQSQTLSDKDKLVYGVIASLTRAKNKQGAILGYCFASNAYLAEVMGCGERTITRAIADLVEAGELIVQHIGVPDKRGNRQRRIYTLETYARGIVKIGSTASFGDTGIDKNGETFNRNDNKRKDNPPIVPQGDKSEELDAICAWKPDRFLAFWDYYRTKFCVKDHSRAGERAAAATAWDKLKPDDAMLVKMAAKLRAIMYTQQWKDGIGIKWASTFLNGVRLKKIDLNDLPEASTDKQAPQGSAPPARRYIRTDIVDGQEVDVYE